MFQRPNRPSGHCKNVKPWVGPKHKNYEYKTEVSVIASSIAVCCNPYKSRVTQDIEIIKGFLEIHKAFEKTRNRHTKS